MDEAREATVNKKSMGKRVFGLLTHQRRVVATTCTASNESLWVRLCCPLKALSVKKKKTGRRRRQAGLPVIVCGCAHVTCVCVCVCVSRLLVKP